MIVGSKLLGRIEKRIEKSVREIVTKHLELIEKEIRFAERAKAVRAGIAAGREDACDHCEHGSFPDGRSCNVPEACDEAVFRFAMKRLGEDDALSILEAMPSEEEEPHE